MPRYIDADNIKLKGISVFDQNLEILISLSDVRKSLQMTPTADVIEVVWCKDCKYFSENQYCGVLGFCEPNEYCSRGERKMKENEGNKICAM